MYIQSREYQPNPPSPTQSNKIISTKTKKMMINNTLPCLDRKKWEKIKAKILRKRTTPCTYVVMPCSYAM